MIQRLQTIFLLLAAACFGGMFVLPLLKSTSTSAQMLADQVYEVKDHTGLLAGTALVILLAVITIFLYKNRKLQLKLTWSIIICSLLFLGLAFFLLNNESGNNLSSLGLTMQAGVFLPVVAIIFCLVAARYIRKDEKLVQSMNRLR